MRGGKAMQKKKKNRTSADDVGGTRIGSPNDVYDYFQQTGIICFPPKPKKLKSAAAPSTTFAETTTSSNELPPTASSSSSLFEDSIPFRADEEDTMLAEARRVKQAELLERVRARSAIVRGGSSDVIITSSSDLAKTLLCPKLSFDITAARRICGNITEVILSVMPLCVVCGR